MKEITTYQEFINESIRAEAAYRDRSAIQTVIDGKRNMGFITIVSSVDTSREEFWKLIKTHNLETIHLPGNEYDAYIYYRKGAERGAQELAKIANRYGGYLSYEATERESRRIGELLGYDRRDIDAYIKKNYR
jgi:hypothetical protein